uniref:Uncharacterized protein n=1 Tax=Anopheles culicifacies TaxID=139723 RepID=A0A182MJA1_9DIPT
MKLYCAVLVLMVALLHFGQTFTPIDSPYDMLAEGSQLQDAKTMAEAVVDDGTVREKRGLKYQYHYKEKSVGGGLFPFKHTVERKVHIKHGHHGLHGSHYREVTKVKHFGFGR